MADRPLLTAWPDQPLGTHGRPETVIHHALTVDGPEHGPIPPVPASIRLTDDSISVTFIHPTEGWQRADVYIEWDAERGGLILRLWDGPGNDGENPRLETTVELDPGEADHADDPDAGPPPDAGWQTQLAWLTVRRAQGHALPEAPPARWRELLEAAAAHGEGDAVLDALGDDLGALFCHAPYPLPEDADATRLTELIAGALRRRPHVLAEVARTYPNFAGRALRAALDHAGAAHP